MTAVIQFKPSKHASAEANLEAFIQACRPLLTAYPGVKSWEDTPWDLTASLQQSGRGKGRIAVAFTSFEASEVGDTGEMSEPFLSFSKAYFLYQQSRRPSKALNVRLAALRCLEKALVDTHGASDLRRTTAAICISATSLIKQRFSEGAAYRIGRELTVIAAFIAGNQLATPFQWICHLGRPKDRNRVGKEADEARGKKLPSQAALDALPRCFLEATEPRDILVSSVAALLCTAPDRIGEVFGLPTDCEIEDIYKGKPIYGLRWWPEKGAEPMVKWIAPTMVDVARAAISKIRKLTQPARDVAAWYEKNSSSLFLPPGTENLRDHEFLSLEDASRILGFDRYASLRPRQCLSSTRQWLDQNNVPRSDAIIRFEALEKAVIARLPKTFPVIDPRTGLKYSEALLVVRANEMHMQRGTVPCLVEPVSTTQVNSGLGAHHVHGASSIFSNLGFMEPDGSPIKITTHQFRHWLNTLAHRGGMSQLDIAKWSGRRDVRQNNSYDHMTSEELLRMTRELTDGDSRLFGPLAELAAKSPISRDEFLTLEFPTAHVTELGFCVHDYTMLPCQKHRDCLNCNEHVCVKGDHSKSQRIKAQLELAEAQLRRAQEAVADGYFGADRWHEHHTATVIRLRNLVEILDDPKVAEGSLIRLTSENEFSPIRLAIEDRRIARLVVPNEDLLDEFQSLLGQS